MDNSMLQHPGIITGFATLVLFMLLLDLGVLNKKSHKVGNKEALIWSLVWIGLSMVFSFVIYQFLGSEKFMQFQSAYWIEKMLSVDNLFVFILVFKFFNVPEKLHHKVLFWGVLGALVFRAIFIFAGTELIQLSYLPSFNWGGQELRINILLLLFGIFLLIAGIKSFSAKKENDEKKDFNKNPAAKLVYKLVKVSGQFDSDRFFTVQNGVRMATPLLVVLCVIEFTDLLFAIDSIPAIFAIAPDDPLILYSSNIFAIMGLRALYFLLANFMDRFSLLHYGLAIILSFIGVKMIIAPIYHIPSSASLVVVASVLIIFLLASLAIQPKKEAHKH